MPARPVPRRHLRSYGNDPLPISIHEMRRRAPLHYWSKAQNARFVAYALWVLDKDAQERRAEQIGYGGSTSTALGEAFFREASLSLELIIKAVIALRIEVQLAQPHVVRVRPVHDLVSLWSDAGLPRLPSDDLHRLMIAKSILNWSGRYAAPLKDEQADRDREAMVKAHRLRSFRWDDFDRIYQVAATSFEAIYPA
jgi:hypothetical protein